MIIKIVIFLCGFLVTSSTGKETFPPSTAGLRIPPRLLLKLCGESVVVGGGVNGEAIS